MTQAVSSKEAAAYLIDPMNAPEPASETGPGAHFGSTFDPAHKTNATQSASSHKASSSTASNSNNPFRKTSGSNSPPAKGDVRTTSRSVRRDSPPQAFPTYRAEAFGDYAPAPRSRSGSGNHAPPPSYEHATSNPNSPRHRRRTSSLKERYPGDKSGEPLEIIRKDSKKANRSPHLRKKHQPGPDTIDRLDPAIGGRAYHHEGPYDAALLARNSSFESSPVAALKTSNAEALKATPKENIKDAVERHKPLDGVAVVPPGMPDRFGRTYNYEEGADLMHEDSNDGPGYKRWADKDYSPDDLKGQSEPTFSLDKALRRHNINDDGIEMTNGSDLYKNGRDSRDPVQLAGGESRYVDAEIANTKDSETGLGRSGSLRAGLKKRIGSLRHKRADS